MLLLLLALAIVVASTSITSAEPGKPGHRPAAPLFNYSSLSLPPEHIPYFLRNNQRISKLCHQDPLCPFKDALGNLSACWGYEKNCALEKRFGYPVCSKADVRWVPTVAAARDLFWKQGDFGYVKERLSEMKTLCTASRPGDSSLRCSSHTRFCQATNLYLDLRSPRRGHERYKEDFIQHGEMGGHCSLSRASLAAEGDHKSPLQSCSPAAISVASNEAGNTAVIINGLIINGLITAVVQKTESQRFNSRWQTLASTDQFHS